MSGSVYMCVCVSAIVAIMPGSVYTWKYMEMRVKVYRCLHVCIFIQICCFCVLCVIAMFVYICVFAEFCVLCVCV